MSLDPQAMTEDELQDAVYGADDAWADLWRRRRDHLGKARLAPKLRHLVFVAGHLINGYGPAARHHQGEAMRYGATLDDLRVILKILDFYRGLKVFQDAQQVMSLWKTGNFPEIKPPVDESIANIFARIISSRKYVANGFRVYSADGHWLQLYLERSDAIKKAATTLDEREIQLLSVAVTLMNHRYSGNWNDGCIQSHEIKTSALGTSQEELLELVQILELCESARTAREGATLLDLGIEDVPSASCAEHAKRTRC